MDRTTVPWHLVQSSWRQLGRNQKYYWTEPAPSLPPTSSNPAGTSPGLLRSWPASGPAPAQALKACSAVTNPAPLQGLAAGPPHPQPPTICLCFSPSLSVSICQMGVTIPVSATCLPGRLYDTNKMKSETSEFFGEGCQAQSISRGESGLQFPSGSGAAGVPSPSP